MTKHAIHLMTWQEAKEAYAKDPVVLIPMGSMEEHGPQSITGDFLAAEKIAKAVAEKTGALYIPVIPFGCSEYFRSFPGTISLSQQTVRSLIEDVAISLIEHNISKIFFVNGHAGNAAAIEEIGRKIRREHNIQIASIDLWQTVTPSLKQEVYKTDETDPSGHGGEPLTSVMLNLYPEQMRMDLLPEWNQNSHWGEFEMKFISKVAVKDVQASVFFNMEEISPLGIMGDPRNASAERGEKIVRHVEGIVEEIIAKLKNTNTRVK